MKRELETAAAEWKTSLVEAARRCIRSGLRAKATQADMSAEHGDRALAHALTIAAGRVLSGKDVPLHEEYDRELYGKDFETCLDTCRRLGLKDLETVLRQTNETEDGKHLFSVLLETLDEPRRLEAERLDTAKNRLINAYLQAENAAAQSAEGQCAPQD